MIDYLKKKIIKQIIRAQVDKPTYNPKNKKR